jgi:type VI secretion system secreted protein Hcp
MPYEAFIRISGIARRAAGGSDADDIHVRSFHWGVSQLGPVASSAGSGTGQAQAQEFSFVKRVDATSPVILQRCWVGAQLPDAVFTVRQTHGEPRECVTYTFREVRITAVRPGGSSEAEDDFPAEEISLSFAQCALEYWSEEADGRVVVGPVGSGWNTSRDIT